MIKHKEHRGEGDIRKPKLKATVTTKAVQPSITSNVADEVKVVPRAAGNESHE